MPIPFRLAPLLLCLTFSACSSDDDDSTTPSTTSGGESQSGGSASGGVSGSGGNDSEDLCGGATDRAARRIATASGAVVGSAAGDSDAFLGIPYVAPPVGERRFAEPAPYGCFEGDFLAQSIGPRCPQLDEDQATVIGDEDCLRLNLWTPSDRPADAALPVLVYIHGGGNAIGGADDPLFDGQSLSELGNVVVTVNYRLGALGFLLQEGVPTNLAVRDQLAALQWVQENAQAFGGDPGNVTLFGESAGAVNTCALLGAEAADGLLHRAIVQSGTCHFRDAATYRTQMGEFTANVGCDDEADPVACLRALPAEDIVRGEPTGYPNIAALGVSWGPHVDGDVMTASTDDQFAAGTSLRVPLMIGSNRDETAASVTPGMTRAQFEALVRVSFAGLADSILEQYPESEFPDGTEAYVRLSTESKFQCRAMRYAELAAEGGLEAYLYMFAYDDFTALRASPQVVHGLELPFIFGTFSALSDRITYTPNADDRGMRDEMQARWLAFARGEAPTGDASPDFPTADAGYLVLDNPSVMGSDEYPRSRCAFWNSLLP